jgi:acetoin utilization protein AcuB
MHDADIRHLPVVDIEGRLIGLLSERDAFRTFLQSRDLAIAVRAVMTKDVITVRPQSRAAEATSLMLEHKISSLPVVDEAMHLVGIVTETDILRLALPWLNGDAFVDPAR